MMQARLIQGCYVERAHPGYIGVLTIGFGEVGDTQTRFTYVVDTYVDCWIEVNRMIRQFHATGECEALPRMPRRTDRSYAEARKAIDAMEQEVQV
mgnify:CR=1 FL=1